MSYLKRKMHAEIDMDYTDIGIFSIETFCSFVYPPSAPL